MAHNYPKITSPYKRTDEKSKTVNTSVWFDDYVKYFGESGLPFYATEKVPEVLLLHHADMISSKILHI